MMPDHALHTRPKTPICSAPDSPVYAAYTPHAPISQSTQHLRAVYPSISDLPTVARPPPRPRHDRAIDRIDPAQTLRRPRHQTISAVFTCTRDVIDTTADASRGAFGIARAVCALSPKGRAGRWYQAREGGCLFMQPLTLCSYCILARDGRVGYT